MPSNERGLRADLQRAVAAQGYVHPTPTQAAGMPVILQNRDVDVLVTTPDRLLDHAGEHTLVLSAVEIPVPDGTDRMLVTGFIHNIRKVLALLPGRCQNLIKRLRDLRRCRRERSRCSLHRLSNSRRWGRRTRRRCGKSVSPEAGNRATPGSVAAGLVPIHRSLRASSGRASYSPAFGLRALSAVSTKFASNGKSLSCSVCWLNDSATLSHHTD